jgi:hypothetical protein
MESLILMTDGLPSGHQKKVSHKNKELKSARWKETGLARPLLMW